MPLPYPDSLVMRMDSKMATGPSMRTTVGIKTITSETTGRICKAVMHGTHIAGMIYARELMEGNDTILGGREQFRRIRQR